MAKKPVYVRPEAPPPRELPREIDMSVLTEQQVTEIKAKAAAKVRARAILDAEQKLLADEEARLDREMHPETVYEMIDHRVNLALYAGRILLDGKSYWHGELYTVPRPVYETIREIEQRTFKHDAEVHGDEGDKFYMKERGLHNMSMRSGMATAGGAPVRF